MCLLSPFRTITRYLSVLKCSACSEAPQTHRSHFSAPPGSWPYRVAEAQNGMGVLYDNGLGVVQDHAAAVAWFAKAADQGLSEAQFNLGLCYDNGRGIGQNGSMAAYWYRKAADQGHVNAQLALADRKFLNPAGLPKRPWVEHVLYAPGWYTGYGVKTVPGVREAIEQNRFDEANQYSAMTAAALNAYCDRLEKATKLVSAAR